MYASFEMAPRVPPLPVIGRTRKRLRRTRAGSRWVNVDDSDIESGDEFELERERMRYVRRSAMTEDGYSQRREVLLYNLGAVVLPEGNGSETDEINNVWKNTI